MDCSLPGSSVHGILQVRVLEWVAILFNKGSWPRDWTQVSCIAGGFLTIWATRKAYIYICIYIYMLYLCIYIHICIHICVYMCILCIYIYICFIYVYMLYIVSTNVLYIIHMYIYMCVCIYIYKLYIYIYIVYMNAFLSTSLVFWNTSRMNHSPKSRFYSWISMTIQVLKCHKNK